MKVPLRYQITEYDCGTTSLINAICYLFDREDVSMSLIRTIETYTIDEYVDDTNVGGTSQRAMEFLSHWITNHAKKINMNLVFERLADENVTIDRIRDCISKGGVALSRVIQEYAHYVIITDIDEKYIYLFDPYYIDKHYYDNDEQVEIVHNEPFKYNRKVDIERYLSKKNKDFALGKIGQREIVLIYRIK